MKWVMLFSLFGSACSPAILGSGDPSADQDVETEVEIVPAVDDQSSLLFDDAEILQFSIELSDDSFDALADDPYTYVEGSFTFDGQTWEPVGVRIKGENSFLPIDEKPSLKIKFDKFVDGQAFQGLTELTLNNMSSDYTMMHERVAYRMYREFSVPAARSNHVVLTLNGEHYGLYANVETVDKNMIARWFEDDDGSLFEVWDVDFYDVYIPHFELEYGENDRSNLQGVADSLESAGANALQDVEEYLSMEGFLRYWAVGMYVAQFDAYPYNDPGDDCHVYDDPTTGGLHFIPHGTDETFYYPDWEVDWAYGIIASRCLQVDGCQKQLITLVEEVVQVANDIDILNYFDEVAAQIEEPVRDDSHKPYPNNYVWQYQASMRQMLVDREEFLRDQLDF